MYEDILEKLSKSQFRNSFHLHQMERDYALKKGKDTICQHAKDFISKRVAPANLPNDGRQTPMKGHPVFIAQHATACCCRGCINKWHHFPQTGELSPQQQNYLVGLIMAWLQKQMNQGK